MSVLLNANTPPQETNLLLDQLDLRGPTASFLYETTTYAGLMKLVDISLNYSPIKIDQPLVRRSITYAAPYLLNSLVIYATDGYGLNMDLYTAGTAIAVDLVYAISTADNLTNFVIKKPTLTPFAQMHANFSKNCLSNSDVENAIKNAPKGGKVLLDILKFLERNESTLNTKNVLGEYNYGQRIAQLLAKKESKEPAEAVTTFMRAVTSVVEEKSPQNKQSVTT